jgi:fibronectin-binding autotransporter adhesin
MRRIPLLLGVIASAFMVTSGSALAAGARTAASPPVNNSIPKISGTAREGHTLTASNGTWSGVAPISYAYQWQRCNSGGSSCAGLPGATNQNYVASAGDVNQTLRVQVTAKNADGTAQALSGPTAGIAASGNAPASTKQPNPSGTPQDGQTIKTDDGSWSGSNPITFTYQWQSCTAVNPVCTNIVGATSSSYAINASQDGLLLRAVVVASNSFGKSFATSNLTTVVIAKASSPLNSALPAISGTKSVGNTLSASTGSWTGVAANAFTYQWTRCNSNGTACSNVSGATGTSYGVGLADLGLAVRVNVTATNSTGSTLATSVASVIARPVIKTYRFSATLRANQEVEKVTSTRYAGHFTATAKGKTLTWTLTFAHLSGYPTFAALNTGNRGANGPSFKTLCRQCVSGAHGTMTLTASQLDRFLRNQVYVNVHTPRHPLGEIRGQVILS